MSAADVEVIEVESDVSSLSHWSEDIETTDDEDDIVDLVSEDDDYPHAAQDIADDGADCIEEEDDEEDEYFEEGDMPHNYYCELCQTVLDQCGNRVPMLCLVGDTRAKCHCTTCPRAYHPACLFEGYGAAGEPDVPEDWSCHLCVGQDTQTFISLNALFCTAVQNRK